MKLPIDFCEKMQTLLGEEYPRFIQGYDRENYFSLRVNPLKADSRRFYKENLFGLSPVKWCPEGFYYDKDSRPGRHPYHRAGVYYIQEASAMAPARAAEVKPGEKVLDLCAAPGGKSTQLAGALQGRGLLVSNEIVPARAKILSGNIERMGIANAVVTNESPADLERHFPHFFDKIIVDAPCSGEGMFRKDENAAREWSAEQVKICANRQGLILSSADKMLAPGGRIIYSTCTFSPEENEGVIARFLSLHPEYRVVKPAVYEYFAPGRPEWADGNPQLADTMRLFPHKIKGEGHFAAVLEKTRGEQGRVRLHPAVRDKKQLAEWERFAKENLQDISFGNFALFGNNLYALPEGTPDLSKIKVLRAGLHLGEIKKGRFEPSHSLAMALKKENAKRSLDLPLDSDMVEKYLTGQEIAAETEKGWTAVCVNGYTLGWGKSDGERVKNHYPKGLRIQK